MHYLFSSRGRLVALVQQIIMLSYGKFALKIEWIGLEGMTVIVLSYSIFVGGLAALLTTLQFRSKSDGILNAFNGFVVSIFAFFGGSFINIGDISETLSKYRGFHTKWSGDDRDFIDSKGAGASGYMAVIWLFYMAMLAYVFC